MLRGDCDSRVTKGQRGHCRALRPPRMRVGCVRTARTVKRRSYFADALAAMKNLIILTHGWSGSSLFASLMKQAGCWLGAETVKKTDYDTAENSGLVELNNQLLEQLLPGTNHEHRFTMDDVRAAERAAERIDLAPYQRFVAACEEHRPWLWKDPRLTWTIRVWARVLPLEHCQFLVLTRDARQAWITSNMRRHVQSMGFTRAYNDGITAANRAFLDERGLPYLQLSFEDLLLTPEVTLDKLNRAYDARLTMDDLRHVNRQPLYRKSRGLKDLLTASLIYAKNYGERDGRGRQPAGPEGQVASPPHAHRLP
jgi:hypothetical protein